MGFRSTCSFSFRVWVADRGSDGVHLQSRPVASASEDEASATFSTFGLAGTSKPGYNNVAGVTTAADPSGFGKHTYQKPSATFGKESLTEDVLKKGSGTGGGAVVLGKPTTDATAPKPVPTKPPVPTTKELEEDFKNRPKKESKNFVTSNAVENILSAPTRAPEPVDWKAKPHYGKVPPYLQKIKKEITDEYEYIRTMQQNAEDAGPTGMRQLEESERLMLVDQLKGKWDEVNATYQRSSVLSLAALDTIGKVKRKEKYEAQLAQIERDIEKLSKKVVYVALDDQE